MSPRRVVVTGIGLVTPLGSRLAEVHQALLAGASGLGAPREIEAEGFASLEVAELAGFDASVHLGRRGLRGMDRSSRLTAAAAALALEDAKRLVDGRADGEIGLVLGTMLSGVCTTSRFDRRAMTAGPAYAKPMDFANTVINAAAGQAAIRLGLRGINATISSGTASGAQAIGYAVDLIRAGRCDALLAGGMDELSWESLLALRGAGLLAGDGNGGARFPIPCDRRRNGMAPGEGAVFLLLEEAKAASRRGAPVLSEVRGHATAFVPPHRDDPGASLRRATRRALADAGMEAGSIDALSLSASGSPAGDRAEARGLAEALGTRLGEIPATAPKAALGETLGASGALAAALLVAAAADGKLPGTAGLESVDDDLGYGALSSEARDLAGPIGLVSARGLDGKSSALIFCAASAPEDAA